MTRLRPMAYDEVERVLVRLGYQLDRQRGSHRIWAKLGAAPISVPAHAPLKVGTLRAIIRATGLSVEDFMAT